MTQPDEQATEPEVRQLDDSPASALEPTAVRAAEQADADKDLPNADKASKDLERKAK